MPSATTPPRSDAPSSDAPSSDIATPAQRSVNTTQKAADPNTPVTDATHPQGKDLPKLPHERDQSVNMTDGIPSADMQQAYRDVKRGLVNTDAGREAHNVGQGQPVQPADPAPPGASAPVEPDPR